MKKIYIVGCAKTGTTLLRRLFNAFEDLDVCEDEIEFNDFIESEFNVGKRDSLALFSQILSIDQQYKKAQRFIEVFDDSLDTYVVYMRRNREDTLKSSNNYVSTARYNACENQANKWYSLIHSYVVFEQLVSRPDEVQKRLAKDLNLKIKHKFSDYPDFIEKDSLDYGSYKLREIGADYEDLQPNNQSI